jgi:RNA polymerase sigma-70 factor, ECF subfamily
MISYKRSCKEPAFNNGEFVTQQETILEEINLQVTDDFLQKLKDHDESCFSLLFLTYSGKIFNLAYRMTGDEEDASDITQETFYQVYRHIESFRGESRLYTWIFSIARNECLHMLKTRKKTTFGSFEELIGDATNMILPSGIAESEKVHLAYQVKEGCLTGLIRCLSFDQRTAFVLHVLLHLSIDDTAAIMEKSKTATKVLIHRARMNLKKFLCKNCSLYDSENPCKCENLIGFSLRQGWITPNSNGASGLINTRKIEEEIHNFDRIMNFYSNLNPSKTPWDLQQQILALMTSKEWMIFSENRV